MFALALLYCLAAAGLALYGFNTLLTVVLYWRKRNATAVPPVLRTYPFVTVQLPIFNELYVVERLIDAAAGLDWPSDHLQIQVLDDSDDETTLIAQARVDQHRAQGVNVEVIHRQDRRGFKAGALAAGLPCAEGDFVAIFDADFVPPADFLKKTIPYFQNDPHLGMVQARWGHLNATYSPLTRAQAIALDGHFMIEQTARSRNNLLMNFNGTAGVWRRACIEDCGGWRADTVAEDLDLSYRAQMRGWKLTFLPEIVAPAEIPPQIHAFKRQQFRWAKGSTQCLVKLGPVVVRNPNLSWFRRVEGMLHLSGYLVHPLMLLLLLTLVPLMSWDVHLPALMSYFGFAMLGPIAAYVLSQRALYPNWRERFSYFSFLMLLGTGIALNNTMAVMGAFLGRENTFRRTPKFNVADARVAWNTKRYTLPFSWEAVGELALAVYAVAGIFIAWQHDLMWSTPFLFLYAAGFAFTGGLSIWHSLGPRLRGVNLTAVD